MQTYIRLARTERERGGELTTSQKKQFNRVRLRLLKCGIIAPVSREKLETLARQVYNDKPAWERWWMRVRFRWAMFNKWRAARAERRKADRALKRIAKGD